MGKIFAQLNPEEHFFKITLKCEPEQGYFYRQQYPEIVVRGYHCPPVQQPYWNTIDLMGFDDKELLFQMIGEAYDAITEKLTKKAKSQLSELTKFEFVDTNGENMDFVMLCRKLDSALDELVGGKFKRDEYIQYNLRDSIHDVIIAYRNGIPVGCGAYKMYDEEHAELKRIFIDGTCRNMGLGSELVRRLEAKAKINGYKWCILETGEPLEAACHIYTKAGYKVIPNYGQYANMPASICMQHKI
jgi:predicted DNA-binding protein (MmcQ/YjbR family)/GNAT superfamily N-acetyltransferase